MKLSRHIAVALEYCDTTGLNGPEIDIYNSIDFNYTVTDWAEESSDINGICDFTGLWDHCVTIELEVI